MSTRYRPMPCAPATSRTFGMPQGRVVPIYDPLTTCGRFGNAPCAKDANGNDIITRQQFPGNMIPPDRIDPAAKVLTNSGVAPTDPAMPFTNVNNFTANASVGGDNDQYNGRVDHAFSEKHRALCPVHLLDEPEPAIDPYQTQTCVDRCTETFNTQSGRDRGHPLVHALR